MPSPVKLKQTRISFSERKLRPRSKCIQYVSDDSSDENSPVKNKEVNREKKRIPRRCLSELQLKFESTTPRRASKRNQGKSPNYKEIEADAPTPTKRKCHSLEKINVHTPVSHKAAKTPSTAFAKLALESPSVEVKSNLKPKELFPVVSKCSSSDEDSPVKSKREGRRVSRKCLSEAITPTKRVPSRNRGKSPKDEITEDESSPAKRKTNSPEKIKTHTPVKNKSTKTPSSAFSKLALESPSVDSKNNLKPKQLFPIFSSARKAFHGAGASSLPCREKELKELSDFLTKHLKEKKCGSLYVSGLPGTGKTASLNFVIKQDEIVKGYQIVKINCTSISSSANVYRRICEELNIKVTHKTENESIAAIEDYLLRKHKMILLILDEIDQLETKTQSVLYKIFEWPSWENAKLVLIGIANAMDLTDRLLPRLCAKVELKPVLMHFAPYSKDQISKILSQRLSEVGAENVFAPSAIEMISAKVAGMSGDIRRALDLGRRVMEMSEEKRKATLIPNETTPRKKVDVSPRKSPRKIDFNVDAKKKFDVSPRKSPRKVDFNVGTRKEVDVSPRKSPRKIDFNVDTRDVFNVVKNIYGSSKNFKSTEDSCFPLHQKLLICTFLLVSKKGKSKDLVVAKLHQVYTKICKKRMITPVDLSGFLFLCRQVEMTGVIKIGKGHGKLAKVLLQWDEAEITNAIKDLHLLSSILNDVACLS